MIFFGSRQNLEQIFRKGDAKNNGFVEFCKAWGLQAQEAKEFWALLDGQAKIRWGNAAVEKTVFTAAELADAKSKLRAYTGSGPYGRKFKKSLANFDDLNDRLQNDGGALMNSWEEINIRDAKSEKNAARPPYKPTPGDVDDYRNVSIPGDQCVTCKADNAYSTERLGAKIHPPGAFPPCKFESNRADIWDCRPQC